MTDDISTLTTTDTPGEALRNAEVVSPDGSEDAIALDFVDAHQQELRYAEGRWYRFNGCRWRDDRKFVAHDMIRSHVRESALGRDNDSQRRATASSKVVNGVERLARTDPRITVLLDDFDADRFALNTPSGIIDLRSGTIRPCDPLALCTKATRLHQRRRARLRRSGSQPSRRSPVTTRH